MSEKQLLFTMGAIFSVVALLGACQPASRPVPVGQIAFLSERDGYAHIYTINTENMEAVRIETGLFEDGCPVWSPDGTKLLFVSANNTGDINRKSDIYVVNMDGSNLMQLTHEGKVYSATWSPDGSQIVFAGSEGNAVNIFLMESDGSNITQLTHGLAIDDHPVWSKDGQYILFSSNRGDPDRRSNNENYDIYSLHLETGNLVRLTDGPELDYTFSPPKDYDPALSPDGLQIAFHSLQLVQSDNKFIEGSNILVTNTDGSNKHSITDTSAPIKSISPTWSPNGQYIAFSSNRAHEGSAVFDIYIMKSDGTYVSQLTNEHDNLCPSWRP